MPVGREPGPPRVLVALLDGDRPAVERAETDRLLAALWPGLNWRARVYLVETPTGADRIGEVVTALAAQLARDELCSVIVHPFVALDPAGRERLELGPPAPGRNHVISPRLERYLQLAAPLAWQSYQRQGEPRLAVFPVLEPAPDDPPAALEQAARALHRRSAKPSAYLRGPAALATAAELAEAELRFYVEEPAPRGDGEPRLAQLWRSLVFEDLLDRVDHGGDLLARCRPHAVVAEGGRLFGCFDQVWRGQPLAGAATDPEAALAGFAPAAGRCRDCISRALLAMTDNLRANQRTDEGRRVHLELARLLATEPGSRPREAAAHGSAAAGLAETPADRAAARVVQGLCHLGAGELEAAEAALAAAAPEAADPGSVAFHRGRVQLAWRDAIEALDHFEVAMASQSTGFPRADLFFHMIVCHVELEEFEQAERYLEPWREAGGDPAVIGFYRGLCRLGAGDLEAALAGFRAALAAGPPAADRGRVEFYLGHTLKELGRFDQAIPALEAAVTADPDELAGHNLLGYCYYKTARHPEAVACFRRALEIDPGSAIDYANLASNLRDLGRTDEAVANYRRALELDPRIDFARENLARLTAGDVG